MIKIPVIRLYWVVGGGASLACLWTTLWERSVLMSDLLQEGLGTPCSNPLHQHSWRMLPTTKVVQFGLLLFSQSLANTPVSLPVETQRTNEEAVSVFCASLYQVRCCDQWFYRLPFSSFAGGRTKDLRASDVLFFFQESVSLTSLQCVCTL